MLYLDSSALVKLVIEERGSAQLVALVAHGSELISSALAAVEVPRALERRGADGAVVGRGDRLLSRIHLRDLDAQVIAAARGIPARVRSLDAIHLATALSFGASLEALVAYDRRLLDAARAAGLTVASPGAR